MAGSATFTTETSRITMNCARQTRIRAAVPPERAGDCTDVSVRALKLVRCSPYQRSIAVNLNSTETTLLDQPGAAELDVVEVLAALADPVRLRIVRTLAEEDGGE